MKLSILFAIGSVKARERFLQKFTVQVLEGLERAQEIGDRNKLIVEETAWPDLFIFGAPEYRTKRMTTSKPRQGIMKRLQVNSFFHGICPFVIRSHNKAVSPIKCPRVRASQTPGILGWG
jgi:hypothetical protein